MILKMNKKLLIKKLYFEVEDLSYRDLVSLGPLIHIISITYIFIKIGWLILL